MEEASKHFIHLDDLMERVGERLAKLTGAEWGMISGGCAACMVGGTCACVAGADPEKMAMLPDTSSMKNECIMPKKHRNVYDRCIWMTGVKMVEVNSTEEMEAAVNDRTAMIATFGAVFDRGGIIPLEDIVRIGKKHSVPVFVDAAAEQPNVPNIYIEAGVNLVAYSGGKYIRGPQDSGILLGRKDLCQAAFLNMAPHHAFGRPMKISKETIMGGLTALDLWINGRDHEAEWKEWERILDYIAQKAMQVPSVTTEILPPSGRSNVVMRMRINWDQNSVKLTTEEFTKQMFEGNPRIYVFGNYINPAMMEEGEEVPVAKRVYEILSAAAV
ncbi:MAG: aminotransferase class V-fold PLP-dependent enzyme [Candidatus Latescibacteria bacterium]|nr:aminotransferase class V-fold PLP-dependent enzyme [Candidatus Latescibacterota bacterium]